MNLNLPNWNVRGLSSNRKKQILHELLDTEKIDIVMLQETKMATFTNRHFRNISSRLDIWHWAPSVGRSGGILFGADSNKVRVLSWQAHRFCLDIIVENKLDSTQWQITTVYGPVDKSLKRALWEELDSIRNPFFPMWVLCGDFNVIRNRKEKSSVNFDVRISHFFNSFISRHNLIEYKLNNRRYTWSNGTNFALLDRIFTTIAWDQRYPSSIIKDESSYGLDHCPLILQTSASPITQPSTFRIDPTWFEQEEFINLVNKWWLEFPLDPLNLAQSWQDKLKFLRWKISGWARNYYGKKKRDKALLLSTLHELELIHDSRAFTEMESKA